ncbi:MAG TPA: TonB-dependent receptor [Steroidobacteraceae bacterium]|nr:TonB-dependent receptor [Steroidobacteraceae bacterium]
MRIRRGLPVLGAGLVAMIAHGADAAESADSADADNLSSLEQVTVTAKQDNGTSLGGASVTQQDMQLFNRDTVDTAFELVPGTAVSLVGARNETDIWIRGFDRWRVPLYQDGIPVYLPYDNRIDFSRFSTVDISQIQVSKGFASVIDGPGAMGGSVNLVSRLADEPLDLDVRAGEMFDSTGSPEGTLLDAFAGTRQQQWFAQASGSFDRQTHFRLSDDFTPGTLQGDGDRDFSYHRDYKLNLKAGYTPDAASEYSINYIEQMGTKDNPLPDGIIPANFLNQVKYWTWPQWDKRDVYWLSQNLIDDRGSFVKVRLYYDKFFNVLDSYDNIDFDTQNTPKAFDSTYDDQAAGGSVELDERLFGGADTVRVAGHYRWDEHQETESTRDAPGAPSYQEPWEDAQESTYSLALENIYRPAKDWQVTAGGSYDVRNMVGDSEWVTNSGAKAFVAPYGYSYAYPVHDKDAVNGEFAVNYAYDTSGSAFLSYADRARFPTLFEMYSTRFGTFVNNPDLQPERSHYLQAGVTDTFFGTAVTFDTFIARVSDAIQSVALTPTVSEDENVGTERDTGFEVDLKRDFGPQLSAGANYSYLVRQFLSGSAVPTDTPAERLFAYATWQPLPVLAIVPNVDVEGRRWLQNAVDVALYYRAGAYTLFGIKAAYTPTQQLTFELGVKNLADRDYVIEDGYNGPGREYFVNARYTL